ncbi:MAG: zinc metallopeptidase [Clostridia bacterium]|nr:zinc metallopeptidase [Clostridia bacterium]
MGFNIGYGIDIYYILLVVPAFLLALWAQVKVKGTYKKMSAVRNSRGLTGAQAASRVLYEHGVTNVQIERVSGTLTDHYDPRSNVIRLSDGVFDSTSVAAVGIACHEAGHAVQYAKGYAPIRVRNAILPVCSVGSKWGIPLAIIGLVIGSMVGRWLFWAGILLYALVAVFQLVTLPVEFNASRRALQTIDDTGMLAGEEYKGARKVLTAAALTYVASLAVSLANLLRLILRSSSRRR